MLIGSARHHRAALRAIACVSAAACVLVCTVASPSRADEGAASLLGRWRRGDDRPGQATGGSFSQLEFLPRGKMVGLQFMAHVFSHGGEVLESGYGHYRIRRFFLSVTPPKRVESDGWPGRGEVDGSTYRCGLAMDSASASFVLSNCALSGTWVREPEAHDAPGQ